MNWRFRRTGCVSEKQTIAPCLKVRRSPWRCRASGLAWLVGLVLELQVGFAASPDPSIARVWDEEILSAIRIDLPNPPVHARNLFHLSAAMYDAWAAYDAKAVGLIYHGKHQADNVALARREAISYAAYRILTERYRFSRNAATTLAQLDAKLQELGYSTNVVSLDPQTAAGVGNRVAAAIATFYFADGALQARAYQDLPVAEGGYESINPPLITGARGTLAVNVNRWQPLIITNAISQNNIPVDQVQKFVGAQWLGVRPFSLTRSDSSRPWFDPGPPPQLGGIGDAEFRQGTIEVIRRSSELTPDDGVMMDSSPGALGNNPLGANTGTGHATNPVTQLPYVSTPLLRGDFGRALAEYWADGPNSETPPGHWNVLANRVSDSPGFERRLGGTGPVLDALEWDVKLYFAINGALHDAACAAWSLKRIYDGYRPITTIRFMAQLGQSSDPSGPAYHKNGLPLIPDLIEQVTPASVTSGRHIGFPLNAIVIRTWPGEPADPVHEHSGTKWILGVSWLPYQKKTFVTPAFPGYVSGHSTFSRAAAEVLTAFTGSPFFPGGIASTTVSKLAFEQGPSAPVVLQWATYFDAADQAGQSRIWGGIHVQADDFTGRTLGAECGQSAWTLARRYFDGSILETASPSVVQRTSNATIRVISPTVRGLFYSLQACDRLERTFEDLGQGSIQATNSQIAFDLPLNGPSRFFRVFSSP